MGRREGGKVRRWEGERMRRWEKIELEGETNRSSKLKEN
jgi:hypothetical protein